MGTMNTTSANPLLNHEACRYCSSPTTVVMHGGACPRVKAIEYYPDGRVKRVEFHGYELGPLPAALATLRRVTCG